MNAKLNRWLKDESGITALETAIILIAFVVVAAIFAFTVLSTGTFLTERSKEAAYAGLQEVRGSMELKGGVVLETTGRYIVFNLATVAGGSSVDLSRVKITYRDSSNNKDVALASTTCHDTSYPNTAYYWSVMKPDGTELTSCILSSGYLAKIVVDLSGNSVTANKTIALELKPPTGGTMQIERTAPALIDTVTDLH